jgi:hypothetical protein
LIGAVLAALVSKWPDEPEGTKATIDPPIVAQDAQGATAHLRITWEALPENTEKVTSEVRSAGTTIYTRTTPAEDGGNLEDEFDVMLGGASSIDATSVPLDKNDSPVAPQASKTFDVR